MIEELETLQRSAIDLLHSATDCAKSRDWEWAREYATAASVVIKAFEAVERANSRLAHIDGIRRAIRKTHG